MFKWIKRHTKNEKGLTLIELLAVVVILGIIAAIAVPAIGRLIDNTKLDAHIANAQQLESAAKLAISSDRTILSSTGAGADNKLTMTELVTGGYFEVPEDPDTKAAYAGRALTDSLVNVTKDATTGAITYTVVMKGNQRGMDAASPKPATAIVRGDFTTDNAAPATSSTGTTGTTGTP